MICFCYYNKNNIYKINDLYIIELKLKSPIGCVNNT